MHSQLNGMPHWFPGCTRVYLSVGCCWWNFWQVMHSRTHANFVIKMFDKDFAVWGPCFFNVLWFLELSSMVSTFWTIPCEIFKHIVWCLIFLVVFEHGLLRFQVFRALQEVNRTIMSQLRLAELGLPTRWLLSISWISRSILIMFLAKCRTSSSVFSYSFSTMPEILRFCHRVYCSRSSFFSSRSRHLWFDIFSCSVKCSMDVLRGSRMDWTVSCKGGIKLLIREL